ncbi:uncharacterized [Tachysurus ichikawai]
MERPLWNSGEFNVAEENQVWKWKWRTHTFDSEKILLTLDTLLAVETLLWQWRPFFGIRDPTQVPLWQSREPSGNEDTALAAESTFWQWRTSVKEDLTLEVETLH